MVTLRDNVFYGLDTDTKPASVELIKGKPQAIPNGFPFYEINTGKVFMYDAENQEWLEQ